MPRHALLIGVSRFADERLARLNAPENDVNALIGILRDSTRGGFETVELSLNEDFLAVRDYVRDQVGALAKNADLSKFIL